MTSNNVSEFHVTNCLSLPSRAVPASNVAIFDDAGNRISDIAGPFNEDSSVNLTCDSEGGNHSNQSLIDFHLRPSVPQNSKQFDTFRKNIFHLEK